MSSNSVVFVAQNREAFGKSATKILKSSALVPASIYLFDGNVVHLSLSIKELSKAVEDYRFLNTIFSIELSGKTYSVLPKDIDFHPINETILHVEFKEIPKKGNMNVLVPVAVINQAKSAGIKAGGKLNLPTRNIWINCNPNSIPEKIVIDIEKYGIGRVVFAKSLVTDGSYSFPENTFILSILGRGKKDKTEDGAAVVVAPEATKQSAAKPVAAKPAPAKPAAKPAAKK
jgi:large subunit ribosomal protein L25